MGEWIMYDMSQQVTSQGYNFEVNPLPKVKELSLDYAFQAQYGYRFHYQRTGFEIKFHHNFWKYLVNYYIPSGILVIFSWVSQKFDQKTHK